MGLHDGNLVYRVVSRDLGPVTAYAAAVNRGYTGTKEEFETLMASYATVAEQAAESAQSAGQSATNASQSAQTAETANGTAQQAATDAQSAQASAQESAQSAQQSAQSASQSATDAEAAKQTAVDAVDGFAAGAQQALDGVNQAGNNWKSLAQAKALDSEAWAVGQRDGEDVGSSDPAYHNNAKWYAESVSTSAQTATEAAQTATQKAGEASQSASQAAASAESIDPDEFNRKIYAAFATATATGAVANFSDGADSIPMKDVLVHIDPVQDLHGYDSPWPAGGGKNLLNNIATTKTQDGVTFTVNANGSVTLSGTATTTTMFDLGTLSVKQGETYTISGSISAYNVNQLQLFCNSNAAFPVGNRLQSYSGLSKTATALADEDITVKLYVYGDVSVAGTVYPQIELGSSASPYAPYSNICPITGWTGATISHSGADTTNPTTYSITFPSEAGTVYGGMLDVTNGVLTVDRAMVTYDGSENWQTGLTSSGNLYRVQLNSIPRGMKVPPSSADVADLVSNILPASSADNTWLKREGISIQEDSGWRIYCSQYNTSDITPWKEFLASNPLVICYELATPITYALTPTEIKSLLGDNNIWADAGDTTVTYRADTAKYIDKKIAEVINALS